MEVSSEVLEQTLANDPFAPSANDSRETLRILNDPNYHTQVQPRGVKLLEDMTEAELVEKKRQERPELYFTLAQKATEKFIKKDGTVVPLIWRPVPSLPSLEGPFKDVESATDHAVKRAEDVIRNGSLEDRRLFVEYCVVGPFESLRHCQETLLPYCTTTLVKLGKKHVKTERKSMRALVRVSTRYYNQHTLAPQVSFQSMGGLAPNNFAERFPNGKVPYDAIREAMQGEMADAMAAELQNQGMPNVTGAEIRAALPDMERTLAGADKLESQEQEGVFEMET